MTEHTTETALSLLYRYGLPEDVIDGALSLHAQELAATIRTTDLPDWFTDVDLFENGVGWAADLITPGQQPTAAASVVRPPATDRTACRTAQHCAYHGWCRRCAPQFAAVMSRVNVAIQRTDADESHWGPVYEAVGKALLDAVLPEPADRAALRGLVGRVLRPWMVGGDDADVTRRVGHAADAVMALMPAQADRAAVLREVEQHIRELARATFQPYYSSAYATLADDISRLAAESAADTPDQTDEAFVPPAARNLPAGTLEAAEIGANRLDAWARTPNGRNFLAHALVQLARTGWLRTEPADGWEPMGDAAEPAVGGARQPKDTDRVVAYRHPATGALFCVRSAPRNPGDIWTPVTAEELEDGGVCVGCGADVLIEQQPTEA